MATAAAAAPVCSYDGGTTTIDLPGAPFAAEPSADGCWLYVSLMRSRASSHGGVAVLHNEGGAFVLRQTVRLDGEPAGLRLTHDGRQLLVAAGDGVSVLDVGRLQVGGGDALAGTVTVGPGTIYLAITDDDRTAFASVENAANIAVIDLERLRASEFGAGAVIGRIPTGIAPVGLALSARGNRLFATSERAPDSLNLPAHCPANGQRDSRRMVAEGLLSVFDVERARVDPRKASVAIWPAGCSPVRVVLGADDRVAWVSARGEDAVYRFDIDAPDGNGAKARRQRIAVGSAPVGLALAPAGDALWVSNSNRFADAEPGTLERMNLADASRQVMPSGRFPRDLRFLPDGKTLVAAVFGSSQLQLVSPPAQEPAPQVKP